MRDVHDSFPFLAGQRYLNHMLNSPVISSRSTKSECPSRAFHRLFDAAFFKHSNHRCVPINLAPFPMYRTGERAAKIGAARILWSRSE